MTMTLEQVRDWLEPRYKNQPDDVYDAIDAAIRERDELRAQRDSAREMHAKRDDEAQFWRASAERAEAELAALKARIAEAPEYRCEADIISGRDGDYISAVLIHDDNAFQYPDVDGKRVRLLVDEPPPPPEPGSLDELRIERGGHK